MSQGYRQDEFVDTETVQPVNRKSMRRFRDRLPALENMSVIDRGIRFVLGALLTIPVLVAAFKINPVTWEFYTSIAACYLLLTAMVGWDPFYAMFKYRTCGGSDKNVCGSLGYSFKAAMGKKPASDNSYETKGLRPDERTKPYTESDITL